MSAGLLSGPIPTELEQGVKPPPLEFMLYNSNSEIDWKHSCLTLTRSSAFAALANLGYTSWFFPFSPMYGLTV